jgi:hypothetical protein
MVLTGEASLDAARAVIDDYGLIDENILRDSDGGR